MCIRDSAYLSRVQPERLSQKIPITDRGEEVEVRMRKTVSGATTRVTVNQGEVVELMYRGIDELIPADAKMDPEWSDKVRDPAWLAEFREAFDVAFDAFREEKKRIKQAEEEEGGDGAKNGSDIKTRVRVYRVAQRRRGTTDGESTYTGAASEWSDGDDEEDGGSGAEDE